MELAKQLLGQSGCAEDGQRSANPLAMATDMLMQGQDLQHMEMMMQNNNNFEDAWEMAQVQNHDQHFFNAWNQAQQQQIEDQAMEQMWNQAQAETRQQEEFQQAWEQSQNPDLKMIAGNIMNTLSQDPNPKYKNSEFFKFIQKFYTGQARIEDNQLIEEDWGQLWVSRPEQSLHDAFQKAHPDMARAWAESGNQQDLMRAFEDAHPEMAEAWKQDHQMQEAWEEGGMDSEWQASEPVEQNENRLTAQEEEMFQSIWNNLDLNQEELESVMKKWQQYWPDEQQKQYPFQANNPYLNEPNVSDIAREKVRIGDVHEAILALEAELQQDSNLSESWRLLGQMHSENDQDDLAFLSFLKGYEIDPYNLDIILCLGVCCTNQYNIDEAIRHLKQWILSHPDYSIIESPNIGDIKQEAIQMFSQAELINPDDINIHQALGVLFFMGRDFNNALISFTKASQLNPYDHTLLNKIGASLSNLSNTAAAIETYSKALDRRPGYVRAWVNTGIAYANQKDWPTAARFYLCALSLNPEAQHVWNYLTTTFACMDRMDLVKKLEARDPMIFKDEFDVITWADLPTGWSQEFAEV